MDLELCGICGHMNDHRGKKCDHATNGEACPCKSGMRTDVLLNRQVAELNHGVRMLFAAISVAYDLDVNEDGEVVKKQLIVSA